MPVKKFFLVLSFVIPSAGFSQKQTTSVEQVWLAYFNQTRFSNKWGMWADVHLRTKEDFFRNFSQFIARAGLTYYVNDNTKLTAGYAYVHHFPSDNHKNISQPEHRPWQQVQWHTKYPRLRLMQWVRLEERFRREIKNDDELGDGYNFNWRLRYNFFAAIPLAKKAFEPKTWAFILNDELHVNAGEEIVYNYFDQNRFFVGFSYQLNTHDNIQLGYMNVFQQLAAGNQYRSIHAARIFYFHNLDLRNAKGR
jgi:Protein of unknown function (DUF2490)